MVSYRDKTVLITGATGFIGGRLAERLAFEYGAKVRVLIRDWRQAVWLSRLPIAFVIGDVTCLDSLVDAVAGCDVVFHCVGVGGSSETCQNINVNGTRNVLTSAKAACVERVVYLSSSAVHGPSPHENASEDAPFVRTGNPYGDSKIDAEEVISTFMRENSQPSIVTLRPTFVWGPRSEWFTVEPIREIRSGTWELVDHGRGSCHAVYVDNLVDAMILAGQAVEAAGQAFLVTDDQPITWDRFFMSYAKMVGKTSLPSVSSRWVRLYPVRQCDQLCDRTIRVVVRQMPRIEPFRGVFRVVHFALRKIRRLVKSKTAFGEWDVAKYSRLGRLDISRARSILGYKPNVSFVDGMRFTEEWLRDQRII